MSLLLFTVGILIAIYFWFSSTKKPNKFPPGKKHFSLKFNYSIFEQFFSFLVKVKKTHCHTGVWTLDPIIIEQIYYVFMLNSFIRKVSTLNNNVTLNSKIN